jgi:uracil phosphoribosyltransferase
MHGSVTVIQHPLVQHKLSLMRQKQTGTKSFRNLLTEISMLLVYEATRDLPLVLQRIETPLAAMQAPFLESKKVLLVSVLGAGNGMLDGMLQVLPATRLGRASSPADARSLGDQEHDLGLPGDLPERDVIAVDPLLATGTSASAVVDRILALGPRSLKLVCLLAAPEGLRSFHAAHPGVPVFTAAIDERLDDHGSIVPGLGDVVDRSFGTSVIRE